MMPKTVSEPRSAADLVRRYNGGERDFSGLDLTGLGRVEAHLPGINLEGADLSGKWYEDAEPTSLSGANLEGANLRGANLRNTQLASISEEREGWEDFYVSITHLERANLEGADLRGANLTAVELEGANLKNAKLRNANLRDANLNYANLEGADLYEADFTGTDLTSADNIEKVKNVLNAKLYDAKLSEDQEVAIQKLRLRTE